jgi:hypothetical protein
MQVLYGVCKGFLHLYSQVLPVTLIKTMHQLSDTILPMPTPHQSGGGRVSSPEHRYAQAQCEDFTGLEADTGRYDLLLLVKRAGKSTGFTPRMIELLDYYMAYTRDIDWEQGARPIVYQSLAKTSLDLGLSERHIQRLEQQLFTLGALTWNDSGNHRRYGQRDPKTGAIIYAYGVDLTPLAYLQTTLQDTLHEKQRADQLWMETKRQISWYRRQIRATCLEMEEGGPVSVSALALYERRYEAMAKPIRTSMGIETLKTLLESHKDLHGQMMADLPKTEPQEASQTPQITHKESSLDDSEVVHYKQTTQEPSNKLDTRDRASPNCFQERRSQTSVNQTDGAGEADKTNIITQTGLQHITLKQALNAASDNFRAHIPLSQRAMDWNDVIEAAYRVRKDLHISQHFWAEACEALGRSGAALCILLTDQATQREDNPVTNPPAYFIAIIKRAHTGILNLHNSIFGILKREEGVLNYNVILSLD